MTSVLSDADAVAPSPVHCAGPLADALAALTAGRPVLVLDDADREDEGDIILPAALASPAWTAWMVRHTSGFLCAPLPAARADELDLPPMVRHNADPRGTAYAVSVDARRGVGTGISAGDRARTARVLADPAARPGDLLRPGHVLPLRARHGGVLTRPGHTEAAVDLCRLAGLPPVALIAEIVTDEGPTARRPAVVELGRDADVPVLDVADVVRHLLYHGDGDRRRVRRVTETTLPTPHGRLRAIGYRDEFTGAEHLALLGGPAPGQAPLVHVHTECVAGEALGSLRCACGPRLDEAIARICVEGGAAVYLRQAHSRHLGRLDERNPEPDQGAAAAILHDLGLRTVRLLPGGVATPAGLLPGGVTVAGLAPAAPIYRCS
jgi:3,4-dihydroxy 2-butanone 4-phosphate synthase / GTP cyclohydrolase II